MHRLLLSALLIVSLSNINAQDQKRTYTTQKISQRPVIDGNLNDPAWEAVEWTGDFIQRQPFENVAPSQQTKFKVIYDNDNVYLAFRCYDSSPDSIVKRMSRRDGFDGDWIEVNIDSYHDLTNAFSFTVTAAGVKGDERVTNNGNWDSSWDPIWYTKTQIDNVGWTAEMKIPLTQLRFGKQDEYVWGLQVNRLLFRKEERSSWQFISPQTSGWVSHFGELYGIKDIKPRKQRDLTPYVVGKLESYKPEKGNPYADGRDPGYGLGLDGKIGVTNDFTLDFTINPDFGQVEADPSEVNLTTFETKFNERRNFFIEGKDIINLRMLQGGGPLSSDNLFYSRRIGKRPSYYPELEDGDYCDRPQNTTILGAFKLTGKTKNGLSIGVMESVTQREFTEIYSGDREYSTEIEPATNYFVARAQKDLNEANTHIGAMVTSTNRFMEEPELIEILNKEAYTGGIDFRHQWKDKTYYFNFSLVGSRIKGSREAINDLQTSSPHFFQRPDAKHKSVDTTRTSLEGYGGTFQVGKAGNGKLRFTTWVTYRSPGLNMNDVGYIRRTDEIQEIAWLGYYENNPKGIYRSYSINTNQWVGYTFGGERKYFGGNINAHITFKNFLNMGADVSREINGLSTNALWGGPALYTDGSTNLFTYFNTDRKKVVQVFGNGYYNQFDNNSAHYIGANIGVNIQLSDAFKLTVKPGINITENTIMHVSTIDEWEGNTRYITGKINMIDTKTTIRANYNITPDFTVQLYAMPFISSREFSKFKYINDAKAENIEDRYNKYTDNQISYDAQNLVYNIDENLDGEINYSFDEPNKSVMDFNMNLVIRWEYRPGSTLFFVWNENRYFDDNIGTYNFNKGMDELFVNSYPSDVILIKWSYRLGL